MNRPISGTRRAQLIELVLREPLSSATVQHGRVLAGTALFVMAAKAGIQLTGAGGFGTGTAAIGPSARSLLNLLVVLLGIRFLIGLAAGVLELYVRWLALGPEIDGAAAAPGNAFENALKAQVEFRLARDLSKPVVWLELGLTGAILLLDGLTPLIVGGLSLR
jgi:hypothetical protein